MPTSISFSAGAADEAAVDVEGPLKNDMLSPRAMVVVAKHKDELLAEMNLRVTVIASHGPSGQLIRSVLTLDNIWVWPAGLMV